MAKEWSLLLHFLVDVLRQSALQRVVVPPPGAFDCGAAPVIRGLLQSKVALGREGRGVALPLRDASLGHARKKEKRKTGRCCSERRHHVPRTSHIHCRAVPRSPRAVGCGDGNALEQVRHGCAVRHAVQASSCALAAAGLLLRLLLLLLGVGHPAQASAAASERASGHAPVLPEDHGCPRHRFGTAPPRGQGLAPGVSQPPTPSSLALCAQPTPWRLHSTPPPSLPSL